ncbi:glycosyltransferase family 2 protein [Flavobacterium capsici]|uniref:Glycosyltransferase family A protein n=1 Tax=Flavobacterium capsici TaxID=3075618 RepID=A0AA96J301_9FLAO|nr:MULTISPECIES: glycosyltransferase family A protein [unclassified Flavobacterium]WNM18748.1 glycosyltransferase family A protein [Flavobacterium sp. PMR2A8]WNM22799.1 glycosyltransferase family A protein [Flavobacterium sp. PMTSA4]
MPYFSIIVPVFNKEKFVSKTIESILQQSFQEYEIIIINDGSTDESEKKINQFKDKRIRYYKTENQGVAKSRNFGISLSTADYICFLDADDYWFPNFLERFHFYSNQFKTEKVFACAIEIETKSKILPAFYSVKIIKEFEIVNFFKASKKESILWTSSVCIHKDVFDKIGVFDENLKISEDIDLWIRIGINYKILFINSILARYVYDDNSVSRNMNYIFEDYFFEKHTANEQKLPELKSYQDLNRFSSIIKYKVCGNYVKANELKNNIDLKGLEFKKRILLNLPETILIFLIRMKQFLAGIGLSKSVFR